MEEKTAQRVALVVDHDNMGAGLDPAALLRRALEIGEVVTACVFADIRTVSVTHMLLYHVSGYRIVHCPKVLGISEVSKDCVDASIMSFLLGEIVHMDVDTVLLVAVDRDYIPAVGKLRATGRKVIMVSRASRVSEGDNLAHATDGTMVSDDWDPPDLDMSAPVERVVIDQKRTGGHPAPQGLTEMQVSVGLRTIPDLIEDSGGEMSIGKMARGLVEAMGVTRKVARTFILSQLDCGYIKKRPTGRTDKSNGKKFIWTLVGKPPERP